MQAIITRVIPATQHKPTRIHAQCSRGQFTSPTNSPSDENEHRRVTFALLRKFQAEDEQLDTVWHWPFFTGQLSNDDYVHVLVDPKFTKL